MVTLLQFSRFPVPFFDVTFLVFAAGMRTGKRQNGKTSSSFAVLANRIDFYFQAGKLTGIQFRLVYCCRFPVHKRARIRLLWFLPLSSVLHWFCQFIFNWFSSSVNSYLPFKMRWGKLEKEKLINLVRPNQILWKKSSSEFLQAGKKADLRPGHTFSVFQFRKRKLESVTKPRFPRPLPVFQFSRFCATSPVFQAWKRQNGKTGKV